MKNNLTLCYLS